jgi:hypothetical protein
VGLFDIFGVVFSTYSSHFFKRGRKKGKLGPRERERERERERIGRKKVE